MSGSDDNANLFDELLELAGDLCNAGLADARTERLNEILNGSRQARQWYVEYMLLHSELFWQQSANLAATGGHQATHLDTSVEAPHRPSLTPDSGDPPSPVLSPFGPVLPRLLRSRPMRQMAALAALLLVGIALGTWGWNTFRPPLTSPSTSPSMANLGQIVARVTGTRNCRWDRGDSIGYGSELHVGQQLNLLEGLAEITFVQGTRMILEAPARLNVAAADRSFLYHGRLTAAVPSGAEGFRVEMDQFTIVDRGTEFGVANVGGSTDVHVFDGLVEGHFFNDSGQKIRTVSWRTDEAVRVDTRNADFVYTEARSSRFIRTLSPSSRDELYAQEDFDYPAGPLGGQNGGFGWGGPWVNISAGGDPSVTNQVAAGSLKIDGVVQVGNHASLIAQENRIRRVLGTSLGGVFDTLGVVEDQDGLRLIGADRTTVYLSFCQRISHDQDGFYGLELHRGDGNSNRVLCIGNGASQTAYGVTSEVNGGARDTFLPLGTEPVEAAFFVIRFDFGGDNLDRVTVYRDPEEKLNEGRCTPQAEMLGNFAFDRVSIGNYDGSKSHQIDRIRLGTTFTAVTDHHLPQASNSMVRMGAPRRQTRRQTSDPTSPSHRGLIAVSSRGPSRKTTQKDDPERIHRSKS